MSLVELLMLMQSDMPRVRRETRKRQAHHKDGMNRAHNEDASWMPQQWIVPTQGTYCGRLPRLYDEPTEAGDGQD